MTSQAACSLQPPSQSPSSSWVLHVGQGPHVAVEGRLTWATLPASIPALLVHGAAFTPSPERTSPELRTCISRCPLVALLECPKGTLNPKLTSWSPPSPPPAPSVALFWHFLFRGMEPAAHPAESESFSSPSFLPSPFPLLLSHARLLLLRPPSLPLSGVFVVLVLRLEGSSVCHLVNANHSSALSAPTVLYKAFPTSWLDRFPTPTLSLAVCTPLCRSHP